MGMDLHGAGHHRLSFCIDLLCLRGEISALDNLTVFYRNISLVALNPLGRVKYKPVLDQIF
jgi:hypothetical protein